MKKKYIFLTLIIFFLLICCCLFLLNFDKDKKSVKESTKALEEIPEEVYSMIYQLYENDNNVIEISNQDDGYEVLVKNKDGKVLRKLLVDKDNYSINEIEVDRVEVGGGGG